MTTDKIKRFKGYEIVTLAAGNKTLSCKVRLPTIGVSKELGSIGAAKLWINERESQPMERRSPLFKEAH